MYKNQFVFILVILCFVTYANSIRFLSDDDELELYFGTTEYKDYGITETYNRQVFVLSRADSKFMKMVIVYNQLSGKSKAEYMKYERLIQKDDDYYDIWSFEFSWYSQMQPYNMGNQFYVYGTKENGNRVYLKNEDGSSFTLDAKNDGILGEDIDGKIIEGTMNASISSVTISGKIITHKDSRAVEVVFSAGDLKNRVKAIKIGTLSSGVSLWEFKTTINRYVSEVTNVYVKVDDDYNDNNFGKNYKISIYYGLES